MTGNGRAGADRRSRRVLTALALVVLSYGLMQTMLVPTVGTLRRDLDAGVGAVSWAVLTAPLLASVALTPLAGALADRYGARRVLRASLGVYLLGTIGAGLAPGIGVLIGFRAVQGIGLALVPLAFVLVRAALAAERVPGGLALCSATLTGSAGAGLLLGGLLADLVSWRAILGVGAGLILIAWAATTRYLPDRIPVTTAAPPAETATSRRPLLVTHGAALLLGANQFLCYLLIPGLSEQPGAQGGFGTSATGAALILLPGTLVTIPASWAGEPLVRRLGPAAPLLAGMAATAAATALLAAAHDRIWLVIAGYLACSIGYGLAMSALPRLVGLSTAAGADGRANGINTVARVLGGALGSQLAATVITTPHGYTLGFAFASVAGGLGALTAVAWRADGVAPITPVRPAGRRSRRAGEAGARDFSRPRRAHRGSAGP